MREAEPSKVAIVVLATALVLVSCTSSGSPHEAERAHVSPAGAAVTSTIDGSRTPTLTCGDYIDASPPASGVRVVDRVVALPASPRMAALQTARTGSANRARRLFAKWGLQIRTGATFTLVVPRRLARVAAI